jgi:N-acyl-D-amino-acid deacylase
MAADVVLFEDAITDRATFAESTALPSGISHVWVNGRTVVSDGTQTGARPGRLL